MGSEKKDTKSHFSFLDHNNQESPGHGPSKRMVKRGGKRNGKRARY